jgi:toluene monooxygenase system ferredoxin subunit
MISADVLKKHDFFKGFTDAQMQKLASIATNESHAARTQIYDIGDPADKLYIVEEGKVVLVMDCFKGPIRPVMQVNVAFVSTGEWMGWSALVEPNKHTLRALCVEKTKLIVLDGNALRKMVDDDTALGLKIMKSVAKLIADRLTYTRIIMVRERGLSLLNTAA